MKSDRQLTTEKSTLHERNLHKSRYDFNALIAAKPELKSFVNINKYGDESIDFANPIAVKILNTALLKQFYQIDFWDIPNGYLCPPIPGRADYIHYAADLLASSNNQQLPKSTKIKVLDIGVGANCVYPIIGNRTYSWKFVGSDIDPVAVKNAKNIVAANKLLNDQIEIRLQLAKNQIFSGLIHKNERFDLTICNPPFHASAEEALAGSQRKSRNLGQKNYLNPTLNFGGQQAELWVDGGELAFISQMILESKMFKKQCLWFSTLVSKSENVSQLEAQLKRADVEDMRLCEMKTGNKITRIIAWTYLNFAEQKEWVKKWS